jgi:superoxide dismutase, Cu-Zn family
MKRYLVVAFAMLGLGLPASAHAQSTRAQLKDAQAKVVGTATLSEVPGGVRVTLRVNGLKPGEHGFHVHAVGKCEPPDFMSAGGHFNPYGKRHGLANPAGPHAGDFPNLEVGADGTGSLDTIDSLVTLKEGANSLIQPGGTSLIIHADPDDEKTDPAGNSGARVACGGLER